MLHKEEDRKEEDLSFPKRITDKELMEIEDSLFLRGYKTKPIESDYVETLLSQPVQATDVKQSEIGNCYFLSSLSSILEQDPHYLQQIMRVNNEGLIEVIFHDESQPNKKYKYVLDPTIITHKHMNEHTNPLIFLLEKAYAIHNRDKLPKEKTEPEEAIVASLKRNELDVVATQNELKEIGKSYTTKHIKHIREKYRLRYNDSLTSGSPEDAYKALLGVQAETILLHPHHKDDYDYYFTRFIPDILGNTSSKTMIPEDSLRILEEMFGDIESLEAKNFRESLTSQVLVAATLFRQQQTPSTTRSKVATLKEFFLYIEDLIPETKAMLDRYFDKYIALPKGMGRYTKEQTEVYDLIKGKLAQGELISLGTKENVGRGEERLGFFTGESSSKGLLGEHSYQVVGCHEKEGRKYLLLRNPWGDHVRGYIKKSKIIDEKKVEVLQAVQKNQSTDSAGWFGGIKKIFNDENKYQTSGYFELELSDLKRFAMISFTNQRASKAQPMNSVRNHIKDFLRGLIQYQNYPEDRKNTKLLERSMAKSMELARKTTNKNLAMDLFATLAIYFHLSGDQNLSNIALNKLNSITKNLQTWNLSDAHHYLHARYDHEIPELQRINLEQQSSLMFSKKRT